MPELDQAVATARRFNRFYTRRAALLEPQILGSRFSLAEARILYELAYRYDVTASDLAAELGLDAGYLSRILARFARDGLLTRKASEKDGRLRLIRLSDAGRAAFAPLDVASQGQMSRLLRPLGASERAALADAMGTIERLLGQQAGEAKTSPISLRRHRLGDIGWIASRQGLLYGREYGWDETFEALVAEILVAFVRHHDPDRERAWIAERDGHVLGSVFLVKVSDEEAKLRLLYVEPDARGLGLGARLVGECVAFARACGYATLTLWTNDILDAARRLYGAAGFTLVAREPHRSFGRDLIGESWALDLRA